MKWEYRIEVVTLSEHSSMVHYFIEQVLKENEHWEHYDSVIVKTELILFFKRPLNPDEQLNELAKRTAQAILATPVHTTIETWGVSADESKITTTS